jgi:hypothetical protein
MSPPTCLQAMFLNQRGNLHYNIAPQDLRKRKINYIAVRLRLLGTPSPTATNRKISKILVKELARPYYQKQTNTLLGPLSATAHQRSSALFQTLPKQQTLREPHSTEPSLRRSPAQRSPSHIITHQHARRFLAPVQPGLHGAPSREPADPREDPKWQLNKEKCKTVSLHITSSRRDAFVSLIILL